MKAKNFYTVAELAELFHFTKTTCELCREVCKKYPDDKLLAYNLQHAYNTANEVDSLLIELNVVDMVLDYYEGINRTTGNNKIYINGKKKFDTIMP